MKIVQQLDYLNKPALLPSLQRALSDAKAEIERLRAMREALEELTNAAEIDLKANQGCESEDDEGGGWWSLRTENAIRAARAILAGDGKEQP